MILYFLLEDLVKGLPNKLMMDSWRIANPQVRMRVTTPPDSAQWKNVEITGYVKVNSTTSLDRKHQEDIPNILHGLQEVEDTTMKSHVMVQL